jgi:hypothetical protein
VLYYDNVLYEKSLAVEKINGMLWVSLPKVPKRFLLIKKTAHGMQLLMTLTSIPM